MSVDAANESVTPVTGVSLEAGQLDLETVFRAQYDRIARVIAGVIRDPARAEELAVDVFLKWDRRSKAREDAAGGWLYRAAVRAALNELRRRVMRSRYERLLGLVTGAMAGGSTPHEIYAAEEDRRRVQIVLSAIQPRQAELLLLRSNDLSYQELASALNLNPASVGTLLSRALAAFRREFTRRYGNETFGERYGRK